MAAMDRAKRPEWGGPFYHRGLFVRSTLIFDAPPPEIIKRRGETERILIMFSGGLWDKGGPFVD